MAPAKPKDPPRKGETIEQQITGAISQGFATVLTDMKAQNAEMLSALKEISRKGSMVARTSGSSKEAATAVNVAQEASERAERLSRRLDAPHGVPVRPKARSTAEDHDGPVSRRDLRERLAESFIRGAESWSLGALGDPGEGPDYTGTTRRLRHGVHMGANGRYYEYGRSGSIKAEDAYETVKLRSGYSVDEKTGVVRDEKGRIRRAEEITGEEEANYLRRGILASRAVDVAKAWKEGQPFGRAMLNAAPKGALRAAGTAAIVVQAANEGWNKIQEQYAKNRQYQEYFGGTNTDQIGERANRWFNENVRGRFSLLGGETYDELWNQAMGMGMRGGHRDEYIKYGSQIMRQGVNSEQTRELMQMTLESGGAASSLRELVSALAGVNRVARDAQVSAKEAREIFIENYKASTAMMFGPSGSAIQQAEAITTSQVNMGHVYMNRIDYTGMNNKKGFTYSNAAQMGLAPSQFYLMNEQYSGLPNQVANEDRIRDVLLGIPSETGDSRTIEQVVNDFMNDLGRPFIPKDDMYDLGVAIEAAGYNRDILHRVLGMFGIQVDSAAAALGAAGNLFTSNAPSQVAAEQQQSTTDRLSKPADLGNLKVGSRLAANQGIWSQTFDVQPSWNNALQEIYGTPGSGTGGPIGRMPGTVELEMLRRVGEFGLTPDTQVVVKAGGEDRVVSLKEALKSFPDQVSNGSVTIVEGEQDGRSIADIMQFTGTSIASKPTMSGDSNAGIGQSLEEFRSGQEGDSEKSGSGDKVLIDLKPRVAEIFDIYVNGEFYQPGR